EGTTFRLTGHPPLATLNSLKEGLFYIQDPSTLLAVHLLDARPGETILDACAAPGGKSSYLAQRIENRGRILAEDSDPNRLRVVRENAGRLGASCVETEPEGFPRNTGLSLDRALVDVPCSNSGVMRRRVELRWRIRPEEIQRLAAAQLKILRNTAQRLEA